MATRRKRGRKTTQRRPTTRRRTTTSPLGNLAKKVSTIDSRVHGLEAELRGIPKRFVRRKVRKTRKLGSLESGASKHWTSGE